MTVSSGGDDGADVDYRRVPSQFAGLTDSERRVVWGVLRSLASASWVASLAAVIALVVVTLYVDALPPVVAVVVVVLLVVSVSLELKANELLKA